MKSTTHRVVILNNVDSSIISQAILILKNSQEASDKTVLAEAERVVAKYMGKGFGKKQRKGFGKEQGQGGALLGAIIIGIGVLCGLTAIMMLW